MKEKWADKYYEEEFEFPLWKLIQKRAEEKDISYLQASQEVAPEYAKTVRYQDIEFEDDLVKKRMKYLKTLEKENK